MVVDLSLFPFGADEEHHEQGQEGWTPPPPGGGSTRQSHDGCEDESLHGHIRKQHAEANLSQIEMQDRPWYAVTMKVFWPLGKSGDGGAFIPMPRALLDDGLRQHEPLHEPHPGDDPQKEVQMDLRWQGEL